MGVDARPARLLDRTGDRVRRGTGAGRMDGTRTIGNLLAPLPDASAGEVFQDLLARPGCRIERIVSHGQTTPADAPCVQPHDEWVLLLAGAARVDVEGVETALRPGDHLLIPARAEHRVTFTDPDRPTVWLAVHMGERG